MNAEKNYGIGYMKDLMTEKKTTTDENIVTDIAKKLKAVVKTLTENA